MSATQKDRMSDGKRYVYPSYFNAFACKKGECHSSCCEAWEIDIDEEALARYEAEAGEFGERLRAGISREGTPHFVTKQDGRCPFLNKDGLCDLILERGEEMLCEICREHPRFYNALPDRIEVGLGLSCEAAAELILGTKECVTLTGLNGIDTGDEILCLRDEAVVILQNREASVDERLDALFSRLGARRPTLDSDAWCDLLLSLETLDPAWTRLVAGLKEQRTERDRTAVDTYAAVREIEYEQLLVYFIYRYMANAFDESESAEYAALAAFSYELIRALGTLLLFQNGKFDFEDLVALARLYSAEIEYSDENVERILDFLRPFL